MIEVGEYVRLKNGKIIKFKKFSTSRYSRYRGTDLRDVKTIIDTKGSHFKYDNIIKHSKNIIDLIEVGDYVNGSKVIDIAQGKIKAAYIENQEQKFALIPIVEKQIKSIVTKEQFASMEYKVKE